MPAIDGKLKCTPFAGHAPTGGAADANGISVNVFS